MSLSVKGYLKLFCTLLFYVNNRFKMTIIIEVEYRRNLGLPGIGDRRVSGQNSSRQVLVTLEQFCPLSAVEN